MTIGGIPLPSSAPLFLGTLAVHLAAGVVAVVAGLVAMFAAKRDGRHTRFGRIYLRALTVVGATMLVLAAMRWSEDRILFLLGVGALVGGFVARFAIRRRRWIRVHITGMGASYTLLLIAFYVDNGAHLPIWRLLPKIWYWLLPTVVGATLIGRALLLHPILRETGEARTRQ